MLQTVPTFPFSTLSVLSPEHVGLLLSVAWQHLPRPHLTFLQHSPLTHTALDKQRVLPEGIVVQKTISVEVRTKTAIHLALVTGAGDFSLTAPVKRTIMQILAGKSARFTINPEDYPAEILSGLPDGMVSPFLPPDSHRRSPLEAIFLLPPRTTATQKEVAISLALSSSLILPLDRLDDIICCYARLAYPTIPVFRLSDGKPEVGSVGC
jgi:hypothetical protein